jgi:DNA repair exonuclease SbcCD ATPase subunit
MPFPTSQFKEEKQVRIKQSPLPLSPRNPTASQPVRTTHGAPQSAADAELQAVSSAAARAESDVAALSTAVSAVRACNAPDADGYAAIERAAAAARVSLVQLGGARNNAQGVAATIASTQLERLAGRYANELGQVDEDYEEMLQEQSGLKESVGAGMVQVEDVRARERELKEIEGSVARISGLMQELQILVHVQGEQITNVEDDIEEVKGHVSTASKLIDRAASIRKKIKKKKKIVAAIALALVVGVVVVIIVVVLL